MAEHDNMRLFLDMVKKELCRTGNGVKSATAMIYKGDRVRVQLRYVPTVYRDSETPTYKNISAIGYTITELNAKLEEEKEKQEALK